MLPKLGPGPAPPGAGGGAPISQAAYLSRLERKLKKLAPNDAAAVGTGTGSAAAAAAADEGKAWSKKTIRELRRLNDASESRAMASRAAGREAAGVVGGGTEAADALFVPLASVYQNDAGASAWDDTGAWDDAGRPWDDADRPWDDAGGGGSWHRSGDGDGDGAGDASLFPSGAAEDHGPWTPKGGRRDRRGGEGLLLGEGGPDDGGRAEAEEEGGKGEAATATDGLIEMPAVYAGVRRDSEDASSSDDEGSSRPVYYRRAPVAKDERSLLGSAARSHEHAAAAAGSATTSGGGESGGGERAAGKARGGASEGGGAWGVVRRFCCCGRGEGRRR